MWCWGVIFLLSRMWFSLARCSWCSHCDEGGVGGVGGGVGGGEGGVGGGVGGGEGGGGGGVQIWQDMDITTIIDRRPLRPHGSSEHSDLWPQMRPLRQHDF